MLMRMFSILILFVTISCLNCTKNSAENNSGINTIINDSLSHCDSVNVSERRSGITNDSLKEPPQYKPIKASWNSISQLTSFCMLNRLNLVQGHYEHNLTKIGCSDFVSRVNQAKRAKDEGDIDGAATYSMINDTIFFIETGSITAIGAASVFLWNRSNDWKKGNNVGIGLYKKEEKNMLIQQQYKLHYEYIAKSDNVTYFNHLHPELKQKIENWDIPFLSSLKKSPKVKGEVPSFVIRVIIKDRYITNCEWIIIETRYEPDASLILE